MEPVAYLVRHGQTTLNADRRLRGRIDVALDDTGAEQARRLAQLFEKTELAAVVSSPLARAVQTALPAAASHGLEIRLDDGLADRDWGRWTGKPETELTTRFGSVEAAPGIEPAARFAARVTASIERCVPVGGGAVMVVAHDAVNRCVLAQLVPSLGAPEAIPQRTGCWNLLRRHPDGSWDAPVVDAVPGDGTTP